MATDDKLGVQHYDQELPLHDNPKVLEAALLEYVEGTPEEKKLVRKIDYHLIPILWAMYVFNYLDRTNIGVSEFLVHSTAFCLIWYNRSLIWFDWGLVRWCTYTSRLTLCAEC